MSGMILTNILPLLALGWSLGVLTTIIILAFASLDLSPKLKDDGSYGEHF